MLFVTEEISNGEMMGLLSLQIVPGELWLVQRDTEGFSKKYTLITCLALAMFSSSGP